MTENRSLVQNYKYFHPADIILVLFITVIIVIAIKVSDESGNDAFAAEVMIPDSSFTLPLDTDTLLSVQGRMGTLILRVEGNAVRVVEAHCPGQDCVNSGWISETGESIICLPSEISVHIGTVGDDYSPDAFTY